jgi:plastocyanin
MQAGRGGADAVHDDRACGRGDDTIVMEKLEISPAEVSARVGDTVEWINKDVLAHTAGNGDFDMMLPPSKSGSVTLTKAGTAPYYCRFHPNMKATLMVAP